MKKLFLILTVLFVSVLTTACINNLAIQELNNKAKAYMEAGETEKAICRYKSSLDLDGSIFETNYNLGVAYIAEKDYEDAIEVLKNAAKLNPSAADTYYSLGVALEGAAYDKISGEDEDKNKVDCTSQIEEMSEQSEAEKEKELSAEDKQEISKLFMDAIDNYNQYLIANPQAEDKEKVTARIEEINKELVKYTPAETAPSED